MLKTASTSNQNATTIVDFTGMPTLLFVYFHLLDSFGDRFQGPYHIADYPDAADVQLEGKRKLNCGYPTSTTVEF